MCGFGKGRCGGRQQLRFALLFAIAFALGAVLAACDIETTPTTAEQDVITFTPTPSATIAPATSTPEPTAPPPTPTPVPPPAPVEPAFPTPDIDLTDYTVYRQTLLEAFAEDADRLPGAPHYFIQVQLVPGEVPSLEGVQRVRITNQEETSLSELYFWLYPNLPAYEGTAEVSRALVDGQVVSVAHLPEQFCRACPACRWAGGGGNNGCDALVQGHAADAGDRRHSGGGALWVCGRRV